MILCYGSVHKSVHNIQQKRKYCDSQDSSLSNPQIDPRLQALIVRFDVMLE